MENNFYEDLFVSENNMLKLVADVSYICSQTYCDKCLLHGEDRCILRKYAPPYWSGIVKEIWKDRQNEI